MKIKIEILALMAFFLTAVSANAQLFETRSTKHAPDSVMIKFKAKASVAQGIIRDSMVNAYSATIQANETVETFFDDYHLGIVIYRDGRPYNLIGFWNPKGEVVYGGSLYNGNGTVKTPFNRDLVVNFQSESVEYVNGMKKGPVFYYCDCAHVLRRGTFNNNVKEGTWEEFTPSGEFIKKKKIKVVTEDIDSDIKVKDWIGPSHCMMRNPDEKIECPTK